ncbi:MAG: hypothetical protein U9N59_10540 [Campylobacterota bacterium]|nr:hypothetical protein [Campylobacterota bacterium]
MNKSLLSLVVVSALSLGFIGCGDEEESTSPSTGTETPSNSSSDLGSGDVDESSSSNDVYTLANTVGFENNKFSISGAGDSSTDPIDWYVFTAPETGIYTCGLNFDNNNANYFLQSTHEDDEDVGGTRPYIGNGTYSNIDSAYGKVLRVAEHNNTTIVNQGDKVYLKLYHHLTESGRGLYTIDCFAPTLYTNAHQTGTITEDNTLINGVTGPYTMSLDSNNSATINGSVSDFNDQSDYFRFQAITSGDYNTTITHTSDVNLGVSLGNGDNTGLNPSSNGSTATTQWSITPLVAGEYYNLLVYTASGNTNGVDTNYTVTIQKQ